MSSSTLPTTISPIVKHITAALSRHRERNPSKHIPPLFVAFQGPQGSGKTFLTRTLSRVLSASPHNLRVAVLSIDDLYLSHSGLRTVAKEHADNKLLNGRGLPGTHDIELGSRLLRDLKDINSEGKERSEIHFPVFDKSLHGGEGDRVPEEEWAVVKSPVDVLLFEGWFVGFCPVPEVFIRRFFTSALIGQDRNQEISDGDNHYLIDPEMEQILKEKRVSLSDLSGLLNITQAFRIEDIIEVNNLLASYITWWDLFDVFVQIAPPRATPYSLIYKWRLEQEHNMKSQNGGRGMDDASVKIFVDRYIPGYIFFDSGIRHGYLSSSPDTQGGEIQWKRERPKWIGNGLRVEIDERRNLINEELF